jgi:hypothetical protein
MPPLTEHPMNATARSSPVATLLAWLAVGLPLAWGVSQTIVKSMALFR